MSVRKITIEIIASLLIALWLYTGMTKMMDVTGFTTQLSRMPFVNSFNTLLGWLVPLSMIAIAILLVIPRTKYFGFIASLGLLLLFSIYITSVLLFSDMVPCTCAGIKINLNWYHHLFINGAGIIFAGLGIWLLKKENIQIKKNYRSEFA